MTEKNQEERKKATHFVSVGDKKVGYKTTASVFENEHSEFGKYESVSINIPNVEQIIKQAKEKDKDAKFAYIGIMRKSKYAEGEKTGDTQKKL